MVLPTVRHPTFRVVQSQFSDRLQLPAGWSYAPRTLDTPLRIVTTDVPAQVLQDDLGNSYSLTSG